MPWNANLFFAVRRKVVEVGNVLLLQEMAAEPAGIEHADLPSFCGSPCVAHAEDAMAAQRFAECRGFRVSVVDSMECVARAGY